MEFMSITIINLKKMTALSITIINLKNDLSLNHNY